MSNARPPAPPPARPIAAKPTEISDWDAVSNARPLAPPPARPIAAKPTETSDWDAVSNARPPVRPPARPIAAKPTEISDWDAETTVTTAPPEWESDTSDDGPSPHLVATPVESERSPAPAPDRVDSLRRRLEEEYGDLPVDDATLVHRARPPRRK